MQPWRKGAWCLNNERCCTCSLSNFANGEWCQTQSRAQLELQQMLCLKNKRIEKNICFVFWQCKFSYRISTITSICGRNWDWMVPALYVSFNLDQWPWDSIYLSRITHIFFFLRIAKTRILAGLISLSLVADCNKIKLTAWKRRRNFHTKNRTLASKVNLKGTSVTQFVNVKVVWYVQ